MGTVPRNPDLAGDLAATRAELDKTLGALRGVMSASLDWRTWIGRHPWPALAVAALVGYRLGRGRFL